MKLHRRPRHLSLMLVGALTLALSACGAEDSGQTPDAQETTDAADGTPDDSTTDVLTGDGVTDDTITLGHLTDLSGVYAPIGKEYLAGAELFVDVANRNGGYCGRQLELRVEDHGYDVQKAQTLYEEMASEVLGFPGVLGTDMTRQVIPGLERDDMVFTSFAWDESLLESDNVYMLGGTYEVAAANMTAWAIEEFGLSEGDTVGILTFQAAFGETTAQGARLAAEAAGMNVEEHRIQFTDTDFTGPITAFKEKDAKVIAVTGTASQLAAMLSTSEAHGLEAEWLAPVPGLFNQALLDGPARDMLETHFYSASMFAMWDADIPAAEVIRENYDPEATGVAPGFGVVLGYAATLAYAEILEQACEAGDITRQGVLEVFQSMDALDADGLLVPLDLTRPSGKSQSLTNFIVRPDSSVEGGLTRFTDDFVSDVVGASDL